MSDPCIRCGHCATVCPVDLNPQFLHTAIKSQAWDQIKLDPCLFCHACTVACPSQINLRAQFISADHQLKEIKSKQEASSQARIRFEAREGRLARKKQLQEAQRLQKLSEITVDEKQAAIQAALARAKWKYEDA